MTRDQRRRLRMAKALDRVRVALAAVREALLTGEPGAVSRREATLWAAGAALAEAVALVEEQTAEQLQRRPYEKAKRT
jgi:hypothetical protein